MRVNIECANCEKSISKWPSQIKEHNFCSQQCHVDYKNKTGFYKKENHPQWKGSTLKKKCKHCGEMFYIKKAALDRGLGRGTFCSRECLKLDRSVKKKCRICEKEFTIKKSHSDMGHGKYCSLGCRTIGYERDGHLRGEKAPRYIDGKSSTREYDRMKAHQRRVKEMSNGGHYTIAQWEDLVTRYGNKCLACGRTDVKLTVDHVVPVAHGGTNNISNLQPLCKSCNSKKHKKTIDYR
jgi:5-methylcytosine-specific restriction endonuclease McrA